MDFIWSNIFKNKGKEQDNTLELLQKVPIFSDLKDRELKEFQRISHIRSYGAKETIFWEGEPGVGMYIIQNGLVQITKKCEIESGGTLLAELGNGDFFGELALLDDSPRSACAFASEETKVIGIFRPDLMSLFNRKPGLGISVLFKLADMIGHRLKATNQELKRLQDLIDSGKAS
jgi:CRP/FNR family transcriptional regulator, cyclic AMP receptor protein